MNKASHSKLFQSISYAFLAVCPVLWLPGTAPAQDPLPVDGDALTQSMSDVTRGADLDGTSLPVCETDLDCDDANACTVDICQDQACSNTQIPECVPCEPTYHCPPVEIVFLMDTSGSMGDEAAALCATIDQLVSVLEAEGIDVSPTILGISETPGGKFFCLDGDVVSLLGGDVPGNPGTCAFPDGSSAYESWGPATAIVAERFAWTEGATHIVVPISDEGPCNGNRPDGCNDPGDDRESVDNAMDVASANGVMVSPISGTGSNTCVLTLCGMLADGTGGATFETQQAGTDLPESVLRIILDTCETDLSCDDENFCTRNDVCVEGVCTGEPIPGCVPCTPTGFCSDGNACTDDECNDLLECISTPNYDDTIDCCDPATGDLTPLDDGVECTDPVCDPETGEVSYTPADDDSPCDDGLYCTTGDVCIAGACMQGGPTDCSALDQDCVVGVCNEDADACEPHPTAEGEGCDDGLYCTEGETCAGGVCGDGSPLDCSVLDDQCNLGTCDEDRDTCTRQAAHDSLPCDDGLYCTTGEVCGGGICAGGEARDCSELDDVCVVGACNDAQDVCVADFEPPGEPCDDDDFCTISDECDGAGVCAGVDVTTITCHDDDECFGTTCNVSTGFCECSILPNLCLVTEPVEGCFDPAEDFAVHVQLGRVEGNVAGGQLFLRYDPASIEYVFVQPGRQTDVDSPFTVLMSEEHDPVEGTIFFAVTTGVGGPGTEGPARMATLWFRPVTTCGVVAPLCLTSEEPYNTVLTGTDGQLVPYVPGCCTDSIPIGRDDASLDCPESASVNADAGGVTGYVTWDPILLTGETCGELSVTRTAVHSLGANVLPLIETGGEFPTGLSQFEYTVRSACGVVDSCTWGIEVSPMNFVDVDVQLSPVMVPQGLNRCIEFEFYSDCVTTPVVVSQTLHFGLPFDLPGYATDVALKIPAGNYLCVTARDPLHTLRSTALPQIIDNRFVLEYVGDPILGGNWLVGGNLDGWNDTDPLASDRSIDALDYGIFLGEYLQLVDPHTPCGTPGPHADINGDGIVDTLDASTIQANFLAEDKDTCCPGGIAAMFEDVPWAEISTGQLRRMGLADYARADLNGDGVVSIEDLNAFMAGERPAPVKELRSGGRSIR